MTEMDLPVPLVGQFFRQLRVFFFLPLRPRAVRACLILRVSLGPIPFP
ncbi:hypothetical protein ACFQMH_12585 [Streptomyces viridiviolaceus]|uniref:Uncharacterized protein n=1 Tax=Streptomyces viridiviolaceus TaxID=68282 RepID=A0ABW2DXZ8_9ACTN|nr:hypothetical protein [Streptomyces viridiviolaceus]